MVGKALKYGFGGTVGVVYDVLTYAESLRALSQQFFFLGHWEGFREFPVALGIPNWEFFFPLGIPIPKHEKIPSGKVDDLLLHMEFFAMATGKDWELRLI